jgi:predicted dehydrogenase
MVTWSVRRSTAGIALFVEKPLALDLATAVALEAAIREGYLVTATGYHWRYLDFVERAAALLSGRVVHLALGYWLDTLPPAAWWARRSASGGQMVGRTAHVFDLARLLVGEVAHVDAACSTVSRADFPGCDIEWAATAALRFESGALGSIASICVLPRPYRIGLHVFADGVATELSERELVVEDANGRRRYEAGVDPFVLEDRDFVGAVRGGPDRIRAPYAQSLATHRVATAAARSAGAAGPPDR